jgi:hypothetical protein
MNKKILITSLLVITLLLGACGSAATGTSPNETAASTPANAQMPLSSQLLIGSLKLDGSGQQISAEQAASLLPLWKLLKTLSTSDTAAQEEIDALVKQINAAMTQEQLDAITAMALTPQDMFTLMQELGIEPEFQGNATGQRPEGFQPPEGFVPGQGGGPGMGGGQAGGPGGGENLTPEQIATAQAMRAERGGLPGGQLNSLLMDALIEYLEKLAQP